MTIEFRCSSCNQLLRVADENAGRTARCPRCRNTFAVPTDAEVLAKAGPGGTGSNAGSAYGQPNNPFSEGKSAYHRVDMGMNPYASPAAISPDDVVKSRGPHLRHGLPWENEQTFGTWWKTAKLIMKSPQAAFRQMRPYGGVGNPVFYTLAGLSVGAVGQILWQSIFSIGLVLMTNHGTGADALQLISVQIVYGISTTVLGVVLGGTVGLFIAAAIPHLFLLVVGGAKRGYETSLRVIAFANGAIGWLNWIPILGPLFSLLWLLYLQVVGFAEAHEIPKRKAVQAVILQIVLCMVLPALGVAVVVAWVTANLLTMP